MRVSDLFLRRTEQPSKPSALTAQRFPLTLNPTPQTLNRERSTLHATVRGRCVHDADDEVRDRSTFYGSLLQSESEPLIKKLITDVNPLTVLLSEGFVCEGCAWLV